MLVVEGKVRTYLYPIPLVETLLRCRQRRLVRASREGTENVALSVDGVHRGLRTNRQIPQQPVDMLSTTRKKPELSTLAISTSIKNDRRANLELTSRFSCVSVDTWPHRPRFGIMRLRRNFMLHLEKRRKRRTRYAM